MKRILIAVLVLIFLLSMAVPALAAGHGRAQTGRPYAAEQADEAEEPDDAADGDEESRPLEFPADPESHAWEHNRSIWSDRHPHAARETTGKPEWAGETTPTANAQAVLARNTERLELKLRMPEEIRAKLASLYADIIAAMKERFGEED